MVQRTLFGVLGNFQGTTRPPTNKSTSPSQSKSTAVTRSNGDGFSNLANFHIWLATLSPTPPLPNAVSTPEPTTVALVTVGGLLAQCRRRPSRQIG